MTNHAPLAPSAAHRWMICPGSVAKTASLPPTDSVYSREGTFGHTIAADLLRRDVDLARTVVGATDGEFTIDEDMADAIQLYLDTVRAIFMVRGGTLKVEQKVRLSTDIWGTADCIIWSPDARVLDVIDLKLGAGVYVEAAGNEQLLIYALAAITTAGIAPEAIDSVNLHIVQPRYFGAAPHRSVNVTGAELLAFAPRVFAAATAARQPGAPLVAGGHCYFCAASGNCEAQQAAALAVAQDLFPDLDAAAVPVSPPLLDLMPTPKLAGILANLDTIEQWISAIRAQAFERAKKGEKIPGFKLVEKIGNRQWLDETHAIKVLQGYGIDPLERSIISPAQVEKKNKALKLVVSQLTHRPMTGISLVPESDARPDYNPADAFKVIPS